MILATVCHIKSKCLFVVQMERGWWNVGPFDGGLFTSISFFFFFDFSSLSKCNVSADLFPPSRALKMKSLSVHHVMQNIPTGSRAFTGLDLDQIGPSLFWISTLCMQCFNEKKRGSIVSKERRSYLLFLKKVFSFS